MNLLDQRSRGRRPRDSRLPFIGLVCIHHACLVSSGLFIAGCICAAKTAPPVVWDTRRVVRTKSCTPGSASSAAVAWVTAASVMHSSWPTCAKILLSAARRNVRKPLQSFMALVRMLQFRPEEYRSSLRPAPCNSQATVGSPTAEVARDHARSASLAMHER